MTTVIKYYFDCIFKNKIFNFPIEFVKLDNNNSFNSKIRSILTNYPSLIHKLIFSDNSDIYQDYQYIKLEKQNKKYDKKYNVIDAYYNKNEILDDSSRFVYIRIDIYGNSNHVNCIIIDKLNKLIILFEPRYHIIFDANCLLSTLDLPDYKLMYPSDLGYNLVNSLQKFDNYCQTYVLFAFHIIVSNPHIEYYDYALMINTIITNKNLVSYWYYIYTLLKTSSFDIDNYIEDDMEEQEYEEQEIDSWELDLDLDLN